MFGESRRGGAGWDGILQGEVGRGGTGRIAEARNTTESRSGAEQPREKFRSAVLNSNFCSAVNSRADTEIEAGRC